MGEILSLKRWKPVEHVFEGKPITFKVRRLNDRQAAPFKAACWRAFAKVADIKAEAGRAIDALKAVPDLPEPPAEPGPEATTEELLAFANASQAFTSQVRERQRLMEHSYARTRELQSESEMVLDEALLERAFSHVINVEGVELDGVPVTTGAELLELADDALVVAVLQAVRGEAELSSDEGKASGSPSTSSPAEQMGDGESGAPSTSVEGGP